METDSLGDELRSNIGPQGTRLSACAFYRGSRSSEYNEMASEAINGIETEQCANILHKEHAKILQMNPSECVD